MKTYINVFLMVIASTLATKDKVILTQKTAATEIGVLMLILRKKKTQL